MDPSHQARDFRQRLLWTGQTALALLLIWLALAGPEKLAVGAAFALIGALAGALLSPGTPYPWRPLRLLGFALYFLRESCRGGIDVARRALTPALPIDPHYQEHQLALGPGLPRTVFVGVISLLPGTLSVRVDPERQLLQVHALASQAQADLADLERRIAWLFSVPLAPDR